MFIGENNYFNGILYIIASEHSDIFIGANCLFSFGIWIRTADPHLIYDIASCERLNYSKSIFIGDHVWVGQNALILKGTKIGSGSVIGGMAVPHGKIPSNTCYVGNPAKEIQKDIFWRGDCVHRWSKEKTLEEIVDTSSEYIFRGKGSIEEIEQALNNCGNCNEKLNIINKMIINSKMSRFCINESRLKTK